MSWRTRLTSRAAELLLDHRHRGFERLEVRFHFREVVRIGATWTLSEAAIAFLIAPSKRALSAAPPFSCSCFNATTSFSCSS
jgi:hypothetical protein